jgi:hypothetical protein
MHISFRESLYFSLHLYQKQLISMSTYLALKDDKYAEKDIYNFHFSLFNSQCGPCFRLFGDLLYQSSLGKNICRKQRIGMTAKSPN